MGSSWRITMGKDINIRDLLLDGILLATNSRLTELGCNQTWIHPLNLRIRDTHRKCLSGRLLHDRATSHPCLLDTSWGELRIDIHLWEKAHRKSNTRNNVDGDWRDPVGSILLGQRASPELHTSNWRGRELDLNRRRSYNHWIQQFDLRLRLICV